MRTRAAFAVVLAVSAPAMATWNLSFSYTSLPGRGGFAKPQGIRAYADPDNAGSFTAVSTPHRWTAVRRGVKVPDSTESVTIQLADKIGSRRRQTSYNFDIAKQQLRQIPVLHNTLPNRNVGFIFEDVGQPIAASMMFKRFHITDGRFDDPRLSWITAYDLGAASFISRSPDGTPTSPLLRSGWVHLRGQLNVNPSPGVLSAMGALALIGGSRRRR